MEIKKLANNVLIFGVNRFIEIFGVCIAVIGILLLISLSSFAPDDPNFIFPENTQIKNFLVFTLVFQQIFCAINRCYNYNRLVNIR